MWLYHAHPKSEFTLPCVVEVSGSCRWWHRQRSGKARSTSISFPEITHLSESRKNIEILITFFETEVVNLFIRLFRRNYNYNPGKKVENKS